MSDDDKNAARDVISELENISDELYVETLVQKYGLLAIAKVLWLIAMILIRINDKLKK